MAMFMGERGWTKIFWRSLVSDKAMFRFRMFIHKADTPKTTNEDFIHKDVHLKAEERDMSSARLGSVAIDMQGSHQRFPAFSISSGEALHVYKYGFKRYIYIHTSDMPMQIYVDSLAKYLVSFYMCN